MGWWAGIEGLVDRVAKFFELKQFEVVTRENLAGYKNISKARRIFSGK